MSEEHELDAILYVLRDTKGLIAIASHLAGAHARILFLSAAALRRMGGQAYAVRTLSHGGPLSTLFGQVAQEVQLIRHFATA
ncbi:MAG TPA: hypothetical protein VF783_19760 [Terriglobales bacterium]